jgi:hypothetical protein
MFVETGVETKGRVAASLDAFARRHPRAFTAALVLLSAAVTLGLMLNVSPPLVLYQGF